MIVDTLHQPAVDGVATGPEIALDAPELLRGELAFAEELRQKQVRGAPGIEPAVSFLEGPCSRTGEERYGCQVLENRLSKLFGPMTSWRSRRSSVNGLPSRAAR